MRKHAFITIALAFLLSCGLWAQEAQAQVDIQIGFLIDGSVSIESNDFRTIANALANAIADPTIVPQNGSIEITVVQFGGNMANPLTRVEVNPTVITQSSITQIADQITAIQQVDGNTPLWAGIDLITDTMVASPRFTEADEHIINVATDGNPFDPSLDREEEFQFSFDARDRAISRGITEIDAEGIGDVTQDSVFRNFLLDFVFPQPGVLVTEEGTVPAPGFVRLVEEFGDFEDAVKEKIRTIIINANGGASRDQVIGLAKRVSRIHSVGLGEFEVDFVLTVENLGTRALSNVQVTDDLRVTFSSPATFSLASGPSATGTLNRNAGFSGSGDRNLLNAGSSTLPAGATETISFTVRVKPDGDARASFCNSATASAEDSSGRTTNDTSHNGSNPDPNGNGDPTESGENQCTPVELEASAAAIPFDSVTSLSLLSLTLAALLIFRMQKGIPAFYR